MDMTLQTLSNLTAFVFVASLKATLLVGAVLLIQKVAGRYLAAGARYFLWFPVIVALFTPVGFNLPLPTESMLATSRLVLGTPAPWIDTSTQSVTDISLPVGNGANAPSDSLPFSTTATKDIVVTDTGRRFSAFDVLATLWLAGVLAVFSTVAISCHRFSRTLRLATLAPDSLQTFLKDCMAKTSCKVPVSVLYSADVQVPMIAGLLKPVLLLPEGMEQQLTRAQLRHVFIHELMHLQRGDIASNWIVALVQALHWFNPAVWFAFFCMRQDRELACDAATLRYLEPADRIAYGHTLLQLNDALPQKPLPVIALGMLDSSSHLQRRIRMLVQSSPYRKLQSLVATLPLLLLAVAAFSQPAPRAAEQVAVVQEPAVAEPQVTVAEPATLATEPLSNVAEPAPTTVPDSARPTLVPASPLAVMVDAPAAPAAAVLAQLDAAPIDAFAPDAGAGITVAAGATDEAQVAPAAAYADLTAIAQLADEIAAIKAGKIRYVTEWNSIAAECDAGSHRPFGNLIRSCRKARLALRSGEVLQFGLECYDLAYRHTALLDNYATTASQQAVGHVQEALQANEQSLTEFCSRETWRTAYPAFAALFEDAKAAGVPTRSPLPPNRIGQGIVTWDNRLSTPTIVGMGWDGSAAVPIP